MAKRKRKGSKATTRRAAKRKPPQGYATWKQYMASIRPTPKGTTMARKKKRAGVAVARRSAGAVRLQAKRRSGKRRSVRSMFKSSGGGGVFSLRGVTSLAMDAGKGAVAINGGEMAIRAVRPRVLPKLVTGSAVASLADAAIGTAMGLGVQKVAGRQAGRDFTAGVYAYVLRNLIRGLGIQSVNNILGDSNGSPRYVNRGGKWVAVSGYPGTGDQRLAGYVGTGAQNAAGGSGFALGDEQQDELGY